MPFNLSTQCTALLQHTYYLYIQHMSTIQIDTQLCINKQSLIHYDLFVLINLISHTFLCYLPYLLIKHKALFSLGSLSICVITHTQLCQVYVSLSFAYCRERVFSFAQSDNSIFAMLYSHKCICYPTQFLYIRIL